jgi:hypothetical protein
MPCGPAGSDAGMRRRLNHRLVKIHRNYTVEEIAQVFSVHKNTVRNWLTQGLLTIDDRKPILILGSTLWQFLADRRQRARQRCGPGEMYCVRCRTAKRPDGNFAEYLPINADSGNLRALCPGCESLMHRRVSLAKLEQIRDGLEILLPEAPTRITDSRSPSLNCDLSIDG